MTLAGRVVLARHRAGPSVYHLLPGGGVRHGETLAEALEREVVEETGLVARIGEPLFISDTIDPNGPRHLVNITFSAEIVGGEITNSPVDSRVEAVDLVDPERLSEIDLRPPIARELVRVLDADTPPRTVYLGPLFTTGRDDTIRS